MGSAENKFQHQKAKLRRVSEAERQKLFHKQHSPHSWAAGKYVLRGNAHILCGGRIIDNSWLGRIIDNKQWCREPFRLEFHIGLETREKDGTLKS